MNSLNINKLNYVNNLKLITERAIDLFNAGIDFSLNGVQLKNTCKISYIKINRKLII